MANNSFSFMIKPVCTTKSCLDIWSARDNVKAKRESNNDRLNKSEVDEKRRVFMKKISFVSIEHQAQTNQKNLKKVILFFAGISIYFLIFFTLGP